MVKLEVILKNGVRFLIMCEYYHVEYSKITGDLLTCEFNKCVKNKPLFLNTSEIAAILEIERV